MSDNSTIRITEAQSWKGHDNAADAVIGVLLIMCVVIGVPANLTSFLYFLQKRKCDLATYLYRAICLVDLCCSLLPVPIIVVLFSDRQPQLFQYQAFCSGWAVLFNFTQQISIFLVLLLSVTRTIRIARPFFPIKNRAVGILLGVFVVFRITHEVVFNIGHAYFELQYKYTPTTTYCFYVVNRAPWYIIDEMVSTFFIAVVPVGITASFIVSVTYILQKRGDCEGTLTRTEGAEKKRVTITMTLFTAISLSCNLPILLNYLTYIICCNFTYIYPGSTYGNFFMYNYVWLVTEPLFMNLNAVFNPILYYCRMKRFKVWVFGKFRVSKLKLKVLSPIVDPSMASLEVAPVCFHQTQRRHTLAL